MKPVSPTKSVVLASCVTMASASRVIVIRATLVKTERFVKTILAVHAPMTKSVALVRSVKAVNARRDVVKTKTASPLKCVIKHKKPARVVSRITIVKVEALVSKVSAHRVQKINSVNQVNFVSMEVVRQVIVSKTVIARHLVRSARTTSVPSAL